MCETASRTMGTSWKTTGKPQENQRKTTGKWWFNSMYIIYIYMYIYIYVYIYIVENA